MKVNHNARKSDYIINQVKKPKQVERFQSQSSVPQTTFPISRTSTNYNPVISQQTSRKGESHEDIDASLQLNKTMSISKKLSSATANSGVTPSIKFGSNRKVQDIKGNLKNNNEEPEGLDVPKETNRRNVKSVIKEEPEKAEVQDSDEDDYSDDIDKSVSKSDNSNNRISPEKGINEALEINIPTEK